MNSVKIIVLVFLVGICSYALLLYSRPLEGRKESTTKNKQQKTSKPSARTEITFTSSYLDIPSDTPAELLVLIDSHENKVSNVQLEMKYNPNILTIISVRPVDFFPNPTILINDVDTKRGRIDFALSLPENQPEIRGKGKLAVISFLKTAQASISGQTSIEFLPKTTVRGRNDNASLLRGATGVTLRFPARQLPVNPIL
jgi:hypothetical protein